LLAVGTFAAITFLLRGLGRRFLVDIALAGVVAALIGVVFGVLNVRIKGLSLAVATLDAQFSGYIEAREGIKSQLEDLADFLRKYADGIDASPARLQQVEDRLASLDRLKRKYGPTLDEVIEKGRALNRERDLLTQTAESVEGLESALA
jgi:DNA repair protein RecN (Recombination protein N)